MTQTDKPQDQVGKAFDLASPGYDRPAVRCLADTARRLAALAGPTAGDRVLDIATGTGWAALEAAAAVGPPGSVVGVDLAEGMLALAREKAKAAGLANVDFKTADATDLPFEDGAFDVAVCASALFFMPDMEAALREWRRVVKPGGRIAFSCFGETSFQPTLDLFVDRLRAAGADLPPGKRPFPWQILTTPSDCRRLLDAVGLVPVRIETAQEGYYLTSKEECWDLIMGTGMRGQLTLMPEEALPAFKEGHLADVWALAVEAGFWLDVAPVYAVGRCP